MPTKILAIDDSKTMRLAIKITFAAEDAKVTAVSKGSEAVARAKQMQADVVLVDHALAAGEPTGFEVVQALKSNPATSSIPVIMLVPARGGVSDADVQAAGADGYIGKPFDTQELIGKVGAVLSRGASRPAATPAAAPAPARAPARAPTTGTTPARPPATAPAASKPAAARSPAKPAAKPAAAKPVAAKPAAKPAAPSRAPANKPAAKPANSRPPASARAAKPATRAAPVPGTRSPARPSAAPARPAASARPSVGVGKIPIAVPIPFAPADDPTPGMLERLRAAGNGAAAGLDPAAVQALLRLSQEVVEQVVWEVVPELAEEIIRQKVP